MITIEFLSKHDKYSAGDIAQVERSLGLRLIGIGKARWPQKKPAQTEAAKPAEEKPTEKKPEVKKTTKKPAPLKRKKIERAIEIE